MESHGHDDSAEIDRLYRFLTRTGPRFGLAIAICADRVLAAEAREQLREQLKRAKLRVATLELHYDDERHDIVQRMIDASADADALFVVGLDRLVTDVFGRTRQTTAIANLNQRRDDLPNVLDVRVVFWVSKAAYPSLSDVAWDLCQVMLTTAELEATRELVIDPVRVDPPPEWLSLARADEAPQLQRQLQNFVRLYETATAKDPRAAGDAAASVAELEIRLGHMPSARTWFERAIACHERAGQLAEAGRLSRRRAEMALFAGELDDAQMHAKRARKLAHRAGSESDAALAHAIVAEIVGRRGDVEAAISTLETAVLPILVRYGDAAAQAEVLNKIANFREVRGELDEALELRKEQIAPLQERAGATRGSAGVQANVDRIVNLHVRKGDLDEAARVTLAAPSQSAGPRLATIAEARGDLETASEIREREGGRDEHDLASQARSLDRRAAQLRSVGELEQALQIRREQELPIYEQLGDTRTQTVVLGEIADLLTALGRTDEAGKVLEEQMLPLADRLGDARLQARASSKALQLRRSHSPAPSPAPAAKQAEARAKPAMTAPAPARKPAVRSLEDAPVSPAAPMAVPIAAPPKPSPIAAAPPVLPSLEPAGEASPLVELRDSAGEADDDAAPELVEVPEEAEAEPEPAPEPQKAEEAEIEVEAKPADVSADRPKTTPSDDIAGRTPEAPIPPPERTPSSLLVLMAVVLVLALVAVALLAKDRWTRNQGELAACTVVILDPDDSRSLVRLQAGKSDVFDEHTVACTPEAQDVRVVVESASTSIHMFEWPPVTGLECTSTSGCVQLYLGCGDTFTCSELGELGCVRGRCQE
jgi:tetratricopeptide (TPR) repeat protein